MKIGGNPQKLKKSHEMDFELYLRRSWEMGPILLSDFAFDQEVSAETVQCPPLQVQRR